LRAEHKGMRVSRQRQHCAFYQLVLS